VLNNMSHVKKWKNLSEIKKENNFNFLIFYMSIFIHFNRIILKKSYLFCNILFSMKFLQLYLKKLKFLSILKILYIFGCRESLTNYYHITYNLRRNDI
jgi:flagellar biosynthesis protein FlhB